MKLEFLHTHPRPSRTDARPRLRRRAFLVIAVAAPLLTSCSPTMDIQVVGRPGVVPRAAAAANCELTFDDNPGPLHTECTEIADAWFGDTGSTINCGYERVSGEARRKGCQLGADLAQIVWMQGPDISGSSCYQMRVRYMTCPKAVEKAS